MSSFVQGNPKLSFWEQNPELRYIKMFNDLIREEGEARSSIIMWAIYITEDPSSKAYRMPFEERRSEVEQTLLVDVPFNWTDYDELIRAYPRLCLTKEQRIFKIWGDKIDEAQVFIKDLPFDTEDAKIRVWLEKFPKIMEGYDNAKQSMLEEESKSKSTVKGGNKEGRREARQKN